MERSEKRERRRESEPNSDSEGEQEKRSRHSSRSKSKSKSRSVLSPAPGKKDWIEKEKAGVASQAAMVDIESESDDDGDMVGPSLPAEHKDKARRQAYVISILPQLIIQIQRHVTRRSSGHGSIRS
jgi:hypothetical protein